MKDGFVKVSAACISSDCTNVSEILKETILKIKKYDELGVNVVVFPELSLVGFTCSDHLFTDSLLDLAEDSLKEICKYSKKAYPVIIVGLPLRFGNKLYNSAAVIHRGKILGFVPKNNLPNYMGFYEKRYFASGKDIPNGSFVYFNGENIPFSPNLIFRSLSLSDYSFGIELCEDLWAPLTPSTELCLAGANLIFNLSASPETLGKSSQRKEYIKSLSSRLICGYVYANAGMGEDCSRCIYSSHRLIYECGALLREAKPFAEDEDCVSEIDVKKLSYLRRLNSSFENKFNIANVVNFDQELIKTQITRRIYKNPFTKDKDHISDSVFESISQIQINSLCSIIKKGGYKRLSYCLNGGDGDIYTVWVVLRALERLGISACENLYLFLDNDIKSNETLYKFLEFFGVKTVTEVISLQECLCVANDDLNRCATGRIATTPEYTYSINNSLSKSILNQCSRYILKNYCSLEKINFKDQTGNDFEEFILFYLVRFGFNKAKISRLAMEAYGDLSEEEIVQNVSKYFTSFYKNQIMRQSNPDGVKVGTLSLSPKAEYIIPLFAHNL